MQNADPVEPAPAFDGFTLTTEQKTAVHMLLTRAAIASALDRRETLGFYGGAGTGKTVSIAHRQGLLTRLQESGLRVGVCTTTHIAAAVLQENLDRFGHGIKVRTLASCLGLRESRRGSRVYFKPAAGKGDFSEPDVQLIDESSMIHPEVIKYIRERQRAGQTVIFIGDEAQLPYVEPDSSTFELSPAMELPDADVARLTEVHRYGGALLERATQIRVEPQGYRQPWQACDDGSSVIQTTTMDDLRLAFKQRLGEDPDGDFRMLAHSNKRVDYWNRIAHNQVYGINAAAYHRGQTLITREAIKKLGYSWRDTDDAQLAWGASALVRIEYEPTRESDRLDFFDRHDALAAFDPFTYWDLVGFSERTGKFEKIRVLEDYERARYQLALEVLKKDAEKHNNWKEFWKLRDAFHSVQYGWASTVHRAQGCGFDTVFLDLQSLHRPSCEQLKRSLIYTAATRARRQIVCVGR